MSPVERRGPLWIDTSVEADRVVLRMAGVLDATTYHAIRDAIVKCALDEPKAIVVDVSALEVPSPSAWSVFTSARWLIKQWPDVPLALVCGHTEGRRAITRNGIVRYVPLYGSLAAAADGQRDRVTAPRRRVRQSWAASSSAVPLARSFVSHWLQVWGMRDYEAAASVVTTALVSNALQHTESDPDLRLETDGVTVTVAVTDGSGVVAGIREIDAARQAVTELGIVAALTRVWGNTPLADGKVVWAVIGPENRL